MIRRKLLLVALALVALTAGVAWQLGWTRGQGNPEVIRVSGNIEVIDAEVSFKIPGRVETRPVDEGMPIKEGDVVATLESSDLRCDVALRQAEYETAQAALAELENGSRPEEKAAAAATLATRQAEVASTEALLKQAINDERRTRAIWQKNPDFVSDTELDQAIYRRLSLEAQLRVMKAAVDQAQAQNTLVEKGPRKEVIEQARARTQQAKSALELAHTRVRYATITSPLTGVVLSKNAEPGEYVAPGTPVVTVGDLVHVWLRSYISETDLGKVKVGQRAWVTTDTFRGKELKRYEGVVSFISSEAEFTPKNVQTEKQRVKLVYRIKIDITNPEMELKPGMPADAEIWTPSVPSN